jgi:heme-degrading monooxygenase HmoA
MIARLWKGRVPAGKAQAYLDLMRSVAIPDYRATPGNRGASCLSQTAEDVVHVWMLTFWDDLDAVRAFAGDPVETAKYYPFDDDFLLEKPPTAEHFEVAGAEGFQLGG